MASPSTSSTTTPRHWRSTAPTGTRTASRQAGYTSPPGAGLLEGPPTGSVATRVGSDHLGRWRRARHLPAPGRQHGGLDHPHRHLAGLPGPSREGGLPLRRGLQARDARQHGPHRVSGRAVPHDPAPDPKRGQDWTGVAREGACPLDRHLAAPRQAHGRPGRDLLGGSRAELLAGGLPDRLDALFYEAGPRRSRANRAHRTGDHGPAGPLRVPLLDTLSPEGPGGGGRRGQGGDRRRGSVALPALRDQRRGGPQVPPGTSGPAGAEHRLPADRASPLLTHLVHRRRSRGLRCRVGWLFPMVTNDTEMTEAEVLAAYKRQPRLERRHATLKGVIEAAPIELKSDCRIDAFGFCLYVALLVHALIERELRRAMGGAGISQLPLYHEDRACKTPTAARVLELLDPLARSVISHRGQVLTVVAPTLSPLQYQILTLLGVPLSTYGIDASPPHKST